MGCDEVIFGIGKYFGTTNTIIVGISTIRQSLLFLSVCGSVSLEKLVIGVEISKHNVWGAYG
jgi:hypothetical protein